MEVARERMVQIGQVIEQARVTIMEEKEK